MTQNVIFERDRSQMKGPYFLGKDLYFYLTLAVIGTLLLSWYNYNSYCILLVLVCRLLDGKRPLLRIRTAFTNRYFLSFLAIFLVEAIGLLHTSHLDEGWRNVENKGALVAIPFIICSGPFADAVLRRRFMSSYCLMLAGISAYCLYMAFHNYLQTRDSSVFFYHTLSKPIGMNAVFFSGYVLCAMLYLFSYRLDLGRMGRWMPPTAVKVLQVLLILFFLFMVVLLSSKLLQILLAIAGLVFLVERARLHTARWLIIVPSIAAVILSGIVVFTNNPVKSRYEEIMKGDPKQYKENKFTPETVFNGVSLRLLIWKYGKEILNEHRAWILGVSPGDAQYLLDQKYIAAGMYLGVPGTHNRGFLGYNFHNQFVQELISNGVVGLAFYVIVWVMLTDLAISKNTKEAWFTILLLLLLNTTESMLQMQHSILLSCFFPFLLLCLPSRRAAGRRPVIAPPKG